MAQAGIFENHLPKSTFPPPPSPVSSSSPPRPGSLASSRMMGIGSDFVQSPTVMAQQDQLPSPLTQDTRGSLPQQIDMAHHSPHAKMRRKSHAMKSSPSSNSVKRSASTPNVRGMTTGSEAAMTLAEKRRKKLGYHRTSVACVHCRRRKIRCLLAPDDPQKRCSNCIRLKKDCNFYPVDQQPPAERRPRTGSKHDGAPGDTSTSSSSSPSMPTPHVGEHPDPFGYSGMPPLAQTYSTPMSLGPMSTTMSPPGSAGEFIPASNWKRHQLTQGLFKAPLSSRFDSDHVQGGGWDPRFFENQHIPTNPGLPDDQSNNYWKFSDPPMTPSFSPYSPGPPSGMFPHGSFSSYSSAPSKIEGGWQPQSQPARSMSYTHIDNQHQRNDSYPSPYPPELRRQTVDMLPPSQPPSLHHSSVTSSTSSMGEPLVTSLSGGPPTSHYPPPGWNAVPSQSPKTGDFSNGWYPESSHLSKVQEEDINYTEHPHSSMYTSAGSH